MLLVVAALIAAACGSTTAGPTLVPTSGAAGDAPATQRPAGGGTADDTTATSLAPARPPATSAEAVTLVPATTTSPPTTLPGRVWPELATEVAGVVITPSGVVAPFLGPDGDRALVTTPCATQAVVPIAATIAAAHIVIDPGHGGVEPGAVGPSGVREADVNLIISRKVRDRLVAEGATVVMTRDADYRITLATRAEIAQSLGAGAFVSIHHNAAPDGPWPGPGAETYYQIASGDSKRLAGLIWEEALARFQKFDADWVADTDAGTKYRPSSDGGDYYGVLRRTAGVPGVLTELAFLSNPSEEALLQTEEFQDAEADAITAAILRFFFSDDPGAGFVEPYPRVEPAGSGGGRQGCVDPEFG